MSRRAPRITKSERAKTSATTRASHDVVAVVAELRAIEREFAPPGGMHADAYGAQVEECRLRQGDSHLEYQIPESFARVLFARLCERYGLEPHRDPDDALTMHLHAPAEFAEQILWPQYNAMGAALARFLHGHAAAVMTAWLGERRS